MEHAYIKPRAPQLNEKAKRSHRSDKDEFYQLLTYNDNVDLEKKLAVSERFYNNDRHHGAHQRKTPSKCSEKRHCGISGPGLAAAYGRGTTPYCLVAIPPCHKSPKSSLSATCCNSANGSMPSSLRRR